MGTQHNIRAAAEDVGHLFALIDPDVVCVEWDPTYEHTTLLHEVWSSRDGNIDEIIKRTPLETLEKIGHYMEDDGFTDELLARGTFLSVDMGMAIYLAREYGKELHYIDQQDEICEVITLRS